MLPSLYVFSNYPQLKLYLHLILSALLKVYSFCLHNHMSSHTHVPNNNNALQLQQSTFTQVNHVEYNRFTQQF